MRQNARAKAQAAEGMSLIELVAYQWVCLCVCVQRYSLIGLVTYQ